MKLSIKTTIIIILVSLMLYGCGGSDDLDLDNLPPEEQDFIDIPPPEVWEVEESREAFILDHPKSIQFSVDITGQELLELTVQEAADLWEINAEGFLMRLKRDLKLKASHYTVDSKLRAMETDGDFRPKDIKDIAQDMSPHVVKGPVQQ